MMMKSKVVSKPDAAIKLEQVTLPAWMKEAMAMFGEMGREAARKERARAARDSNETASSVQGADRKVDGA